MKIFTFRTVCGHYLRDRAKFRRDRMNDCGVIASFRFPKWRPSAILDFQNMQIFIFERLTMTICILLQISSRSVERLRIYCKFTMARHFEFVKYAIFKITDGLQSKSAYLYKISSRSVERLQKYCEFSISNMAAVRHLGFL